MLCMDSIFIRTSVRDFEDRVVEPHKIEKLLRAAMAAPSAVNQQPWEFYVVQNPVKLQEIAAASPYAGSVLKAPAAIVPCYDKKRLAAVEYADIDMSAACENILLEAVQQGLGAVWLGIAPIRERMDKVAAAICLPENLAAFAIIPFGYPVGKKAQQDRYDTSRVHYI